MSWIMIGTNGKWTVYKREDEGRVFFNVSKTGPPQTDEGYYDLWSLHGQRGMNPNDYKPIEEETP